MTVSRDKMHRVCDFWIGNQTYFFLAAPTKNHRVCESFAIPIRIMSVLVKESWTTNKRVNWGEWQWNGTVSGLRCSHNRDLKVLRDDTGTTLLVYVLTRLQVLHVSSWLNSDFVTSYPNGSCRSHDWIWFHLWRSSAHGSYVHRGEPIITLYPQMTYALLAFWSFYLWKRWVHDCISA